MESPPFGAGLSAGTIDDPELAFAGARAHNRFLVELCATSPERRGGIGLVPITHDVERSVAEIEWLAEQARHPRDHGPDDVARPRCPTTTPTTTRCGRRARPPGFPVHTHSGEAPREEMNDFIGIYLAEVVWWAHRPIVAPAVQRRVRALPGPEVRRDRGGGLLGRRHEVEVGPVPRRRPHHEEDGRADEGHHLEAAVGVLRREHLRRRVDDVEGGDPAPPHPSAATSRCGAPTTRTPRARGRTRSERLRSDFGDVPVGDTRKLLGETAARCYGFDLDALRPIADAHRPDARGPRPGPSLRHRPRGGAPARWWKDEYKVQPPG